MPNGGAEIKCLGAIGQIQFRESPKVWPSGLLYTCADGDRKLWDSNQHRRFAVDARADHNCITLGFDILIGRIASRYAYATAVG